MWLQRWKKYTAEVTCICFLNYRAEMTYMDPDMSLHIGLNGIPWRPLPDALSWRREVGYHHKWLYSQDIKLSILSHVEVVLFQTSSRNVVDLQTTWSAITGRGSYDKEIAPCFQDFRTRGISFWDIREILHSHCLSDWTGTYNELRKSEMCIGRDCAHTLNRHLEVPKAVTAGFVDFNESGAL